MPSSSASSACWKASACAVPNDITSLPARPLASNSNVSLVLVSPSMETMLKETSAASFRAVRRNAGSTLASVARKPRKVAISG